MCAMVVFQRRSLAAENGYLRKNYGANTELLAQSAVTRTKKTGALKDVSSPPWLYDGEYMTADKVPDQYREPYILTGYRQPGSSIFYCVASAFRSNNETVNIWTHLMPIFAFTVYFWKTFPTRIGPLSRQVKLSLYYPLLSEEISIIAYHLCSTTAHTFNCMSPRVRHVCFYIDYAAICTYGIGIGCSNACYSWPLNSEHFLFQHPLYYIKCCSLLCIVAMYVMCSSRHKWPKLKYVVRTCACMSMFLYTNSPAFYRCWRYLIEGQAIPPSMYYMFAGWTACLAAAVVNPSRVPERFCPSMFDTIGNSHQLMHILASLASLAHIWAIQIIITEGKDRLGVSFEEKEALHLSLQWTFGTLIVTLVIALWFGKKLTSTGHFTK